MLDAFLNALKDSLITFVVILILYFILSFIENYIANKISKKNKFTPLFGASIGLIPQCGFSIVAADLYSKKKITMGTILAVFIACSDEAIPIMLSACTRPQDFLIIAILIIIKFLSACVVGFIVDGIFNKRKVQVARENAHHNSHENKIHHGCCNHSIEKETDKKNFVKDHIFHPLIHSLKIFVYIFIINIIFNSIIYLVGEDIITNFLRRNLYITPIFASLIGLIPNCSSSVILTKMFLIDSLSFGSTIAGLICNAGLGLVFLFKNKNNLKNNLLILLILVATSITVGYLSLILESMIR